MEPPRGVLASVWNFICFLPFFNGLLILGVIKGMLSICSWVLFTLVGFILVMAFFFFPKTNHVVIYVFASYVI